MGVNHRLGIRKLIHRQMMVGYNHVDSEFFSIIDLVICVDSVIDGDNQLYPFGSESVNGGNTHTVALFSLGYGIDNVSPFIRKVTIHKRSRSNAVHVVVAVNSYSLALFHSGSNSRNSPVHINQLVRVAHLLVVGQKFVYFKRVAVSSCGQNEGNQLVDFTFLRKLTCEFFIIICYNPLFAVHLLSPPPISQLQKICIYLISLL